VERKRFSKTLLLHQCKTIKDYRSDDLCPMIRYQSSDVQVQGNINVGV